MLPEHIRALVTEIETEIGEEGAEDGRAAPTPTEIIEGRPAGPDGRATVVAGSAAAIEQAVRGHPRRDRRGPRPARASRATPARVHRMYAELTAGYHVDPERLVNGAIFDVDYSEMVVVKDIPFYTSASTTCCRSSAPRPSPTSPTAASSGCRRSRGSSRCTPGGCRSRSA